MVLMVAYRREVEKAKAEIEFDRRLALELPSVSHISRRQEAAGYAERLESLIAQYCDPWLVRLFASGGRVQYDLRRLRPLPPWQRPSRGLPPGVRPLIRELVARINGNNGAKSKRGELKRLESQVEQLLEEVKLRTPLGAALRD